MPLAIKDLVQEIEWTSVEKRLLEMYPDESPFLSTYKKLYWQLMNVEPNPNNTNKFIELDIYQGEDDFYFEETEGSIEWLLSERDFMDDWKEILGFYIPSKLLREITKEEILVHIFMEMFYSNFEDFYQD